MYTLKRSVLEDETYFFNFSCSFSNTVCRWIHGLRNCEIQAKTQGIKIYDQEINAEGDSVYTYNISDESITKLSLVFAMWM